MIVPSGDRVTVGAGGLQHSLLHYPADGPPLYLVPGITSTAIGLDFVASAVRNDLGMNVWVCDMRGRGRSDRAGPGRYRLTDHADDLCAIVARLGLDQPVLAGHSLGARIVVAAALAGCPHRGIVAIDPPLSGPERPYPTSLASFRTQLAEAAAGTTVEQVRRFYPRWPERELALRAQELPTCDPVAVEESHAAFESDEFEPLWAEVPGPLALIRGVDSPVVTTADEATLRGLRPDAVIEAVPAAGHMVPWDAPGAFHRAFTSVLHTFTQKEVSRAWITRP